MADPQTRVVAPAQCPRCGARVCLEVSAVSPRIAALHCGRNHDEDDGVCDWREDLPVGDGPFMVVWPPDG